MVGVREIGRGGPVPASSPRVQIFDVKAGTPVLRRSSDTVRSTDPIVNRAYDNAKRVDDFFRTTYKRNGWDNNGSPIKIGVHQPSETGGPLNNAFWEDQHHMVFVGDGDGKTFKPLGDSLDVLAHEVTHGVVDAEVNLRYSGQQGGVNEAWSDVLAATVDSSDWLIGEDVYTPGTQGDAIRDLRNPRFGHVEQLPPGIDVGVHDMSGIPSLAAVKVAETVGRDTMGQIWYRALTEYLDSRAGFAGAARATLNAARDLHGAQSSEFSAVRDAWKAVGVDARWKA